MQPTVVVLLVGLAALVAAQQGGEDGPPPFLRRATPTQLKSFQQMIQSNGHLNDQQLDAKVQAWINQQGGNVQADWTDFQKFIKQSQGEAEKAHKAALASFSPAAKAADEQLAKISQDPSLSVQAKGEKIQAFINALPAAVRNELDKASGGPQGGR